MGAISDLPQCTAAQTEQLRAFRAGFYNCLTGWPDALFELCDAVLCSSAPVCSVPTLSLEPVFRRSHGSLYKGLERGSIDTDALRALLVVDRPTSWPLVFAVDASSWARCDAETSPDRGFYYSASHHSAGQTDRGRLVVSVDLPAGLGDGLLDRAARRDTHPAGSGCDQRHHRPGPSPGRAAAFCRRRAAVRVRRRIRPDRADPRVGRHPRSCRRPHPIGSGLLRRP